METTKKPSENEIFKELKRNYEDAKTAKTQVDKDINKWLDIYDGKPYGNEQDARSKMVVRDVFKTVESIKPNITEPFIGSGKLVDAVPYTAAGEASSEAAEKMLNYQFVTQMDRRYIMNMIASLLTKEGTTWVKSGWKYEDDEFKTPMTVPVSTLGMIPDEYEVVKDNGDGSVDIITTQIEIYKNESTLTICKNEHIFPDPTAESDEDMGYLIHQYESTVGRLQAEGVYKNLDELKAKLVSSSYEDDTALASLRSSENRNHGQRKDLGATDTTRKKIQLLEYWGEFDMEGDGVLVPILCVWEKKTDTILRLEENPMADKKIPFERSAYIENPFSLWGSALAEAMEDSQKIHTAFMRGFIDNAALANNGQKFIMKGGMDQINFRRMVSGEKHIYMNQNPNEVMMDGGYNQMPQSVFQVYEMVEQINEGLTGISRINQGLDAGATSQTATGVSTLTSMAQRRMLDTVRNVSNMLRKTFRHQLANSIKFLTDDDWMRITGMQKPQGELGKDFDIRIDLITDAVKQAKIGQFNLMMQNLQYVGEGVRFEAGNMILSKYFELFDEPALAEMVRKQEPPQPSQEEQQMMQLEMAEKQADVGVKQSQKALTDAQAQKTMVDAQLASGDSQSKMQEMQMKMQELQLQMQIESQKTQQALAIENRKAEQTMVLTQDKAELDMQITSEKAKLDMDIVEEKSKVDINVKKAKATSDIANKKAMANAQPKTQKTKD